SLVHFHFQRVQICLCFFDLTTVTIIFVNGSFFVRHIIIICSIFIGFECVVYRSAAPGIRQDQLTHIPLCRDYLRQLRSQFQRLCLLSAFCQRLTVCLCGIGFPVFRSRGSPVCRH